MTHLKAKAKSLPRAEQKEGGGRVYESEANVLQSLRLIAAPNPQDDLSVDELKAICNDPSRSSDMVRHLIEFIKSI